MGEIVHRDLTPENLFPTTYGRIKIRDVGLAQLPTREAPGWKDVPTW